MLIIEENILTVIYHQTVVKESENHSCLIGIWTHDLCDASALLYWLSYQANRELACHVLS